MWLNAIIFKNFGRFKTTWDSAKNTLRLKINDTNRPENVHSSLNKFEKDLLKKIAFEKGLLPSAYVRSIILEKLRKEASIDDVKK